MVQKPKRVVVSAARSEEQQKVLETIQNIDECPFCEGALAKYHKKPILFQTQHWILTPNQWPYDHTAMHALLIAKKHAERLYDLGPGAGDDLVTVLQWAEEHFQIESGAVFIRFGDPEFNGGSVNHLHAHLITPNLDDPNWDKIKVKLGVNRKHEETPSA